MNRFALKLIEGARAFAAVMGDQLEVMQQGKVFRAQQFDPNIAYGSYGVPLPEAISSMPEAYSKHIWTYAAVYAIASNFASIEYKAYRGTGKEKIEDPSHPFLDLLENPNPFQNKIFFREFTQISLEMTGNAYWAIERDSRGEIIELWCLPSHLVRIVATKDSMAASYVFEVNGKEIIYPYEDIIHFKYTDPMNMVYGQASAVATRLAVTTDLYAAMWNKNFFRNSARLDAVLETDMKLGEDEAKRTRDVFSQMFGGNNTKRVAVLHSGIKYKPVEYAHTDMEFLEGRKMNREEVLSGYGVPPVVVGLTGDVNYATAEQQLKIFWQITMLPKLRLHAATLTKRGRDITKLMDTYFEPDLTKVEALREDELRKSVIARNYDAMGVPMSQITEMLRLPFTGWEGWDKPRPQTPSPTQQISQDAPAADGGTGKKTPQPSEKEIRAKAEKAERRATMWRRFDGELQAREDRMTAAMKTFFNTQRRRVKRNLEAKADALLAGTVEKASGPPSSGPSVEIIFNLETEREEMVKVTGPKIRSTYFGAATRMAGKIGVDFNLKDPVAQAWLEAKTSKLVLEATATTQEAISEALAQSVQDAVAQGFSRSETINEIAARIDDVYDFALESRSTTIARTEVIAASNAGGMRAMEVGGVEKKEWLTVQNASPKHPVRDSHAEIDGQVVPVHEPFLTGDGNALDYPGDPQGPPEDVINCRCTLLPVLAEGEV